MDKVTNKDILVRTRLTYMEDLLIKKNLRWTGHDDVTRRAPVCVCVSICNLFGTDHYFISGFAT